jgi:hypothetical protein
MRACERTGALSWQRGVEPMRWHTPTPQRRHANTYATTAVMAVHNLQRWRATSGAKKGWAGVRTDAGPALALRCTDKARNASQAKNPQLLARDQAFS